MKYFFLILVLVNLSFAAPHLSERLNESGSLVFGEVRDFQVSQDGELIVYRADQDTVGFIELYAVGLNGGSAVNLSNSVSSGANISIYTISDDGGLVAYASDDEAEGQYAAYIVPSSGGAALKVGVELAEGQEVRAMKFSPDGAYLVYRMWANERESLWSVPVTGGASVQLTEPLPEFQTVFDFNFTSDSSLVIYRLRGRGYAIHTIEPDGEKPNKLVAVGDGSLGFGPLQLSADESRVIYHRSAVNSANTGIFSAPVNGQSRTTLVIGADVNEDFLLSPDRQAVVFGRGSGLYRISVNGGSISTLVDPVENAGAVEQIQMTPDGETIVYVGDRDGDSLAEIRTISFFAENHTLLQELEDAALPWEDLEISGDGGSLIYWQRSVPLGLDRFLYRLPLAGGEVNQFDVMAGSSYTFTQDRLAVVYRSSDTNDSGYMMTAIGAGINRTRIIDGEGRDVSDLTLSEDGGGAVFLLENADSRTNELWRARLIEPGVGGPQTRLSPNLATDANVSDFLLTPDAEALVFLASKNRRGVNEIYRINADGSGEELLSPVLPVDSNGVSEMLLAPDGMLIYLADLGDGLARLYRVPIAGGESIPLHETPLQRGVRDFQLSPDERYLIYRKIDDTGIYRVSVEGGASRLLTPEGTVVRDLGALVFSSDGERVLVEAEDESDRTQLYRIFLNNGSPLLLAEVDDFAVTPNGEFVVYVDAADEQLYRLPVDGGSRRKLNGTLTENDRILNLRMSPDGRRVAYQAQVRDTGRVRIYTVRIQGVDEIRAVEPDANRNRFPDYFFSPDGNRLIFLRDNMINIVQTSIRDVSVDGVNERILRDEISLNRFELTPDRKHLIYVRLERGNFNTLLGRLEALPVAGGDPIVLSDYIDAGNAESMEISYSPDGHYLFTADLQDLIRREGGDGGGVYIIVERIRRGILHAASFYGNPFRQIGLRAQERDRVSGSLVISPDGARVYHLLERRNNSSAQESVSSLQVWTQDPPVEWVGGDGSFVILQNWANDSRLDVFSDRVIGGGVTSIASGQSVVRSLRLEDQAVLEVSGTGRVEVIRDLSFNGGSTLSGEGVIFSRGEMVSIATGAAIRPGRDLNLISRRVVNNGSVVLPDGAGLNVQGELFFTASSRLLLSGGGLSVSGDLILGGDLVLTLANASDFVAGDTLRLWQADNVSGSFSSVNLPVLGEGLFWVSDDLEESGLLAVSDIPQTFADFETFYQLQDGATGDDDGDGVGNLVEFVFGLDPRISNEVPFALTFDSNRNEESFRLALSTESPRAILEIQANDTLSGSWDVLARRSVDGVWSGSAQVRVLSDEVLVNSAQAEEARFYRVMVALPE